VKLPVVILDIRKSEKVFFSFGCERRFLWDCECVEEFDGEAFDVSNF